MILPHVGREDLAERMAAFYAEVDEAIAAHGPDCRGCGDCCKFDRFGHRLYVTNVELVYFVRGTRSHWHKPVGANVCPYQAGGLCIARRHRPLGCRVFHCDPDAQVWQGPEYERRLAALKQITADFGIGYRYTDWLSALEALGTSQTGEPTESREFVQD
ncbi:MAG: hypothetical protein JXQ75_20530 [Phycisphaerae bacterium]|nr:hypothetical protein [Phycisphaerae bacterium]